MNQKILTIVIILSLMFTSCAHDSEKHRLGKKLNSTEKKIQTAILRGYYTQINADIGLAIYQDNIYYFNTSKNGFTNDKFLLHLLQDSPDFENLDFFKSDLEIQDSLKNLFKNVSILHKKINIDNYKQIRTGQFIRENDGTTKNVWLHQASIKNIFDRKEYYKNQLQSTIKENLINEDFEKTLEIGVFFKANKDFFILMSNEEYYVISDSHNLDDYKFMFHLIKEDNTFENLSFNFKTNKYQQFLELPYKNLSIARIDIPEGTIYSRLRIGQFNETGSLWVQEINIAEVYSNELLRYDDEFKHKSK